MKTCLIIPVFDDRPALERLISALAAQEKAGHEWHLVVIEDGSLGDPVTPADLGGWPHPAHLITLRRNVGHQRAIAIGLSWVVSRGGFDSVLIMDSDGEDRPEDVPRLLSALGDGMREGHCEVVVAERRKRQESRTFKAFYRIYRGLFTLLTGSEIRFGNFCAMTAQAAERLVCMGELWMHVPGTVIASRLPRRALPTDRGKRYVGDSKMNKIALITHGLRSMAVFTETILTRILSFCALVAGASITLILLAFAIKVFGHATPGWLTIAVGALLGLLAQTATIALIALLLAINTHHASALMPIRFTPDYVKGVESVNPG